MISVSLVVSGPKKTILQHDREIDSGRQNPPDNHPRGMMDLPVLDLDSLAGERLLDDEVCAVK